MSREAIERIRDAVQDIQFWASRNGDDPLELELAKKELNLAIINGRRILPSIVTQEMATDARLAMKGIFNQSIVPLDALRSRLQTLERIEAVLYDAMTTLGEEPPVDAAKRRGLQLWNDGKTWREVNAQLGREPDDHKATEMELKRFAEKNSIAIRKGKPGRTKGTQLEQ